MRSKSIVSGFALVLVLTFMGSILFSSPVSAAQKNRWKMGTCWTPNILLIEGDKHFIELVNELSAGELDLKLFPAGTL